MRIKHLAVGLAATASWLGCPGSVPANGAGDAASHSSACLADSGTPDFFADEVWAKVAARTCLKCHRAGGDAEESEFVLRDPARDAALGDPLAHNLAEFAKIAALREDDGQSRMLLKVVGELDHGGEDVLEPDSSRYRILETFIERIAQGEGVANPASGGRDDDDFFAGIKMIAPRTLARRLTLSLGARLPTAEETESAESEGLDAIPPLMDCLMAEEAFYDRLAEGFEDIFLTTGYDDVPENALSYEHFEHTRHWNQKFDLSHAGDEDEQTKARYKLTDDYREAMLREPAELIKYIVRNGRPFTEVITADYIMVSPYTARGYGIFEEVKDRFENPDNHLEFIPVRIKALTGRSESTNQESATGYYPHAGILSTFQYLKRYPTTETNRNRLRVRMYYQQFLGIDIMQLAPRVNDAAAITAQYKVPVMEAADCVVCHKIIDPVAGVFQDYYALDGNGVYQPRKDGWFTDMFPPGHEGAALPEEERWRGLQWLAERTARDPRFAVAMVEHVWYILTGRKALLPPEDIEDPLFRAKERAYREQRRELEAIAAKLAGAEFNLKAAFKAVALSPFYRADGMAAATDDPARLAELDDVGLVRLLAPEQLDRKVAAIFGEPWGKLDGDFQILYGGIDSKEVTERLSDPSGAMGAIQRMMANEVACRNVPLDFASDPGDRRLFPDIEPDVVPEVDSPAAEDAIRTAIVHLHDVILGRQDDTDSPEVDRTYALIAGILRDARGAEEVSDDESYFCRVTEDTRLPDPHYTLRAWRGVVTYLLRQQEFLYE